MKYKNPYYKKIKRSFKMVVSCGKCKKDLVLYQKQGKGNLLNMHIDRIIKSEIDLSKLPSVFECPECSNILGTRMTLKQEDEEVYKMHRSMFNTKVKG